MENQCPICGAPEAVEDWQMYTCGAHYEGEDDGIAYECALMTVEGLRADLDAMKKNYLDQCRRNTAIKRRFIKNETALCDEVAALKAKIESVMRVSDSNFDKQAALKAQLGLVEKLWENCPDKGTEADAEDYVDAMTALLSTAPEVLAVVDGLAIAEKISSGSTFYGCNDQLAVWRPSDCTHPDWANVTAIIISREASEHE